MTVALLLGSVAIASAQVTLEVAIADATHLPFYQDYLIPAFEAENPDIRVMVYHMGWSAPNYLVRYAAGNPPDVFQGGTGMFGLSAEGAFASLNPFIEKYNWQYVVDEFPPAVVQALTLDGHLYGVPWTYSSDNFTYLANRFAEAGLDPERAPDTWDELVSHARALTRYNSDGDITFQGFWIDSHRNRFAPILYQAGGSWMNEDFTRATFGSDYGLEAVQWVYSLLHEYRVVDPSGNMGHMQSGEAAMMYTSASRFQPGDSPYYDHTDVQVGLPPMQRRRGQRITPNTWQISSVSDVQDEAFRWIMFVMEVDNIVEMGQELSTVPVRRGAQMYSPWADDVRWLMVLESIQYGELEPLTSPHWEHIRNEYVSNTLSQIMYEGAAPTAIIEVERLANAWLQEQLSR